MLLAKDFRAFLIARAGAAGEKNRSVAEQSCHMSVALHVELTSGAESVGYRIEQLCLDMLRALESARNQHLPVGQKRGAMKGPSG